jgi:hypothetical protein
MQSALHIDVADGPTGNSTDLSTVCDPCKTTARMVVERHEQAERQKDSSITNGCYWSAGRLRHRQTRRCSATGRQMLLAQSGSDSQENFKTCPVLSQYHTGSRPRSRPHFRTALAARVASKFASLTLHFEAAHEKRTKTPTTFLSRW